MGCIVDAGIAELRTQTKKIANRFGGEANWCVLLQPNSPDLYVVR